MYDNELVTQPGTWQGNSIVIIIRIIKNLPDAEILMFVGKRRLTPIYISIWIMFLYSLFTLASLDFVFFSKRHLSETKYAEKRNYFLGFLEAGLVYKEDGNRYISVNHEYLNKAH